MKKSNKDHAFDEHDLQAGVRVREPSSYDTSWATVVSVVDASTKRSAYLRDRRCQSRSAVHTNRVWARFVPADDDIDFLWVTHDVSAGKDEQLSECKNRDENLERGWGSFILLSPFMSH